MFDPIQVDSIEFNIYLGRALIELHRSRMEK